MTSNSALLDLVLACAPLIATDTAMALVQTESSGNPHAIGVVGNELVRQPSTRAEALATARQLAASGWDFSVGLGQINQRNFRRLGLDVERALQPCTNLQAMQAILIGCFERAGLAPAAPAQTRSTTDSDAGAQHLLRRALSCYYSGNFRTGLARGDKGQPSYVDRVIAAASHNRTRGSPPTQRAAEKTRTAQVFP